MNKYELALVVTAKIDDSARNDIVEKAKGYIARSGGEILGVEKWGRKRLAYEIDYQREGYYYFIHFESEPTAPAAIERDVRIMDNILRYLIVRHEDDFVMPELTEEPEEAGRADEMSAEESVVEAEEEVIEEAAPKSEDEAAEDAAEAAAEEAAAEEETAEEDSENASEAEASDDADEEAAGDDAEEQE